MIAYVVPFSKYRVFAITYVTTIWSSLINPSFPLQQKSYLILDVLDPRVKPEDDAVGRSSPRMTCLVGWCHVRVPIEPYLLEPYLSTWYPGKGPLVLVSLYFTISDKQ